MKTVRLACLLIAGVLLLSNPDLLWADPTQCCKEFQQHCDDWCSQNGHGTGMITTCYGYGCMEECWCTGLCGGQYCEHEDPGGTWCPPCPEW